MCQSIFPRNGFRPITDIRKCACGAVTVQVETDGFKQDYSMREEVFNARFEGFEISGKPYYCCNHCASGWGIDLCACGSGQSPDECDGDFSNCGQPSQELPW